MWPNNCYSNRVRTAVLLTFVFCLSGGWLSMVNAGDVDISTTISCEGVSPPPQNTRRCYETEVDDICEPSSCQATLVPSRGKNLNFKFSPPQTKLKSPGGTNYRNAHLCPYSVTCPEVDMFMYYGWVPGNFIFEPAHLFYGCLDYVQINTGFDAPFLTCGDQEAFNDETASQLDVEFRSNTENNFAGLQMDILCVSPFSQDDPAVSKRSVGSSKCRELPDLQGNSTRHRNRPGTPAYDWPPTGKVIHVPRRSAFRYHRNTIRISHRRVLVTYRHIKKLIFWTPFNRVRLFIRQAPPDVLYGGGVLKLYRHYAYYSTSRIPPKFEPNNEERRVIGILLNATQPFFQDQLQDGGDIDRPNVTTPSPTPTSRAPRSVGPTTHSIIIPSSKPHRGIDPRIDLRALVLAKQFQNACNIFLRGAARSYLSALDELGIRPRYYG